jgi:RsiW-degrading membrane proteinase PrsW (M82 family)
MIVAYILIALFVAWIWVDYFRLIDIFEKNNLLYVTLVFVLGACSVGLVLLIQYYFLYPSGWDLNGEMFNDFMFSVFGIGLVEEIAKITPFLLFHGIFRKKLNEPIDYLTFICVSALGFSAAENVMYYQMHGSHIIISRSILCSISHMFDTAILAYGFILLRFHPKFKNPLYIFGFLLMAALAHGIYDFWLLNQKMPFGYLITLVFYFYTISIFATILNNALNNSPHFSYKKAINTDLLAKRMFLYYGVVFFLQFVIVTFETDLRAGLYNLLYSFLFSGTIVAISVLRLSRFTLIEGRWNKIKFELPFHLFAGSSVKKDEFRPFGLQIKGSSHNEAYLAEWLEEYVYLISMDKANSQAQLAYIEKKIHLKDDQVHYIVKAFQHDQYGPFQSILIKPKEGRGSHTRGKIPIVAKMSVIETPHPYQPNETRKKYRFEEWVYVKKRK